MLNRNIIHLNLKLIANNKPKSRQLFKIIHKSRNMNKIISRN